MADTPLASGIYLPSGVTVPRIQKQYANPIVQRPESYPYAQRQFNPFLEYGTSGLRQFSGWNYDEWLSELHGRDAAWRYREFADNDPVAGGFLFAVEMLARRVQWTVEGGDPQDAEFLEQNMHDMSQPWDDFICEALSMLIYGYCFSELVYKYRQGGRPRAQLGHETLETEEATNHDPASSKYSDGKVGWRKIPMRAQETTLYWDFDGYSSLRGMIQLDWHGDERVIPIEKAVLFRTRIMRANPEGFSMLRRAWTSFYRLRHIEDLESVGAARDLAGIPSVKPPPGVDLNSPAYAELFQRIQEMVTTIHRDEDEGLVWPSSEWDFELVSTGGSRQFDTDKIIRRLQQRIAASVLADFMLLGQDGLGSYAMVDVKSELFGMAIDAILNLIAEPLNRYAVPRLFALNGIRKPELPRITPATAGRIDLEKIGVFLSNMALAGAPIPWSKSMMGQLFSEAGLPPAYGEEEEAAKFPPGGGALGKSEVVPKLAELPRKGKPNLGDVERDAEVDRKSGEADPELPLGERGTEVVCPACRETVWPISTADTLGCPNCGADLTPSQPH